jgi:hypothetical protein
MILCPAVMIPYPFCCIFRGVVILSKIGPYLFSYMSSVELSWVELSLSYGRRPVDEFVLVLSSPLGPMIRFYPYPFFSDNYLVVLPVGRPLWREDGSATYSAITDRSGHWGPITILYRLIWDCVPSWSPLTTRRDYSGGILTRLHRRISGNFPKTWERHFPPLGLSFMPLRWIEYMNVEFCPLPDQMISFILRPFTHWMGSVVDKQQIHILHWSSSVPSIISSLPCNGYLGYM